MMPTVRFILSSICAIIPLACTVTPTVEYNKITKPSDMKGDEIDTFYLQSSIIKIDKSVNKPDAGGAASETLSITSIPTEYNVFKVGIRRADTIGVRTNLNITKFSNTALVKEAGVDVVDNRVALINQLGTIATKIVPLVAGAPGVLSSDALPKKILVDVVLNSAKIGPEEREGVDAADGVLIDFGPIPPDASPTDDLNRPMVLSGIIYSACRDATVKFKYGPNMRYEQTVKISDPRYYQRVGFPVKGKVSFHDQCGVSVAADTEKVSTAPEIIDALVTQGKAIKDAIEAAKKDGGAPAKPGAK